jgi:hypothetical protein
MPQALSAQGRIEIGTAQIVNGIRQPGLLRWLGNASIGTISQEEKSSQKKESFSGQRLPYRRSVEGRAGKLMVKFDELTNDNLALGMMGTVTTVSTGSAVVGYAFPSGAKVGDILAAPAKNLSAVAIKDSTGTPLTLVLGTNYTIDPVAGSVELLNLGAFVQPFKMDYTPGAYVKVSAFTTAAPEMYMRFNGVNTDTGEKIMADFYRVRSGPFKTIELISDTIFDFDMEFDLLVDSGRPAAGADGQFYNITKLA